MAEQQQQQQNQPQQGQQPQGQEVIDNEFDPIIWSESEDIRVQDLSGSLIQEALTLIKKQSIPNNPIIRSLGIDKDETAVDEYCGRYIQVMKDCCSLAIVCQHTKKLLALAVCKVMSIDEFDWTLWKIMPTTSHNLDKFFTLQYDIVKSSDLSKGLTFHCFDIVISQDLKDMYPDEHYDSVLLKQGFRTAISLRTGSFTYTCFKQSEFEHATEACMKIANEIQYVDYKDAFGNKVFHGIPDERTAYYMIRKIKQKHLQEYNPDDDDAIDKELMTPVKHS